MFNLMGVYIDIHESIHCIHQSIYIDIIKEVIILIFLNLHLNY